jgi:cobalt-zinc-cadmium efflux system protein
MHDDHRGPPYGSGAGRGQRRLLIVLGLTGTYLLAEVVGGLLAGSLALIADAGHMLADVMGLATALAAIRFAQRPATPAKTYGFYRAEVLAALANGLLLFVMAGYILYEAWRRLQEPVAVQSLPMLAVAAGGLAVNLIGAALLHASARESLNVQGAFLEVVGDLFGSLGVLLEATPGHIGLAEVEAAMRTVPGVRAVHDLHVWTITSGFVAMSAHVLAEGRPSDDVLSDLRQVLGERFAIEHTTLQVEQADGTADAALCSLDPRCLVVGTAPAVSAADG